MPFPIDAKLVVAVASSALFDMAPSHRVFAAQGVEAYREFQVRHRRDPLPPRARLPLHPKAPTAQPRPPPHPARGGRPLLQE